VTSDYFLVPFARQAIGHYDSLSWLEKELESSESEDGVVAGVVS